MKADGLEYEERMEALDDVTWPRPLADLLEQSLRTYRQRHPWVDPRDLSPKSVVREMFERAMTFGEFVAHHKLARAEGVVLRYLTDAYRALRSTVPDVGPHRGARRPRRVARGGRAAHRLQPPRRVGVADPPRRRSPEPRSRPPPRGGPSPTTRAPCGSWCGRACSVASSCWPSAGTRRWRRSTAGSTAEQWQDAARRYLTEYDAIGTGPAARGPALFASRRSRTTARWTAHPDPRRPRGRPRLADHRRARPRRDRRGGRAGAHRHRLRPGDRLTPPPSPRTCVKTGAMTPVFTHVRGRGGGEVEEGWRRCDVEVTSSCPRWPPVGGLGEDGRH